MAYNFPVMVGQIWWEKRHPDVQFEITEIKPDKNGNGFTSFAQRIGVVGSTLFGPLDANYLPVAWEDGWTFSNKRKTFSRVNPKSLRKKVRAQMAASLLTDKP